MSPDRFQTDDAHILEHNPAHIAEQATEVELEQGSEAWREYRRNKFNGSDAPAMMGVSPYETRGALLRRMATGHDRDVSDFTRERVFAKGHEVEETERAAVEMETGLDLPPATFEAGILSVSLDGFDPLDRVSWECKQWNAEKAQAVAEGRVPDCDVAQVQAGMMLSGAEYAIYSLSDGDEKRASITVERDLDVMSLILAGWRQFLADLLEFDLSAALEDSEPEFEAVDRGTLPALVFEASAEIKTSNLEDYTERAVALFGEISTDLQTDEDFAQAETDVKFCGDVETKVASAIDAILDQTGGVRKAIDALESLKETARRKRLDLGKLVKARKDEIREELIQGARDRIQAFAGEVASYRLGGRRIPFDEPDLAGAAKGKRLRSSIEDALDQAVANAKLEISATADTMRRNRDTLEAREDLQLLREIAPDLVGRLTDDPESFEALIESKVRKHEQTVQAEQERRERAQAEKEAREAEQAEKQAETPPPARQAPSKSEPKPADVSKEVRAEIVVECVDAAALGRALQTLQDLDGVEVIEKREVSS